MGNGKKQREEILDGLAVIGCTEFEENNEIRQVQHHGGKEEKNNCKSDSIRDKNGLKTS